VDQDRRPDHRPHLPLLLTHLRTGTLDVIARNSRITEVLAAGRLPSTLPEISDTLEPGQNYVTSYLAPGEVFTMTWQGGGGYGDPLTRDPDAVARDVREQKVTAEAARAVYGVILEDGTVNPAATKAERDRYRARRRDRSQVPGDTRGQASLAAARRLDDNLVQAPAPGGSGTIVACRHCAEILDGADPRRHAGPRRLRGAARRGRAAVRSRSDRNQPQIQPEPTGD
jgi:N-methylhydantoinase B